jgi:hypothetical protein
MVTRAILSQQLQPNHFPLGHQQSISLSHGDQTSRAMVVSSLMTAVPFSILQLSAHFPLNVQSLAILMVQSRSSPHGSAVANDFQLLTTQAKPYKKIKLEV